MTLSNIHFQEKYFVFFLAPYTYGLCFLSIAPSEILIQRWARGKTKKTSGQEFITIMLSRPEPPVEGVGPLPTPAPTSVFPSILKFFVRFLHIFFRVNSLDLAYTDTCIISDYQLISLTIPSCSVVEDCSIEGEFKYSSP